MDELQLYIPMGVKPENELFKGFGKKQMLQAFIGAAVGGVIAVLIFLISQNVTYTIVAALASVAGSVMMTIKDDSNLSVVDQIRFMLRFRRSQKLYPYRYGDEWRV